MNKLRRWFSTLVGFYRPEEDKELDPVTKFLYSARSVILVISVQAAVISGLASLISGFFNPLLFLLVLAGFVALHMVSNLSNDYFGYIKKNDIPGSPRLRYTPHPIASGYFTKEQIKAIMLSILSLPLVITAYITIVRGPLTMLFAIPGFLLLYLYDASKVTLKSIGLGEIAAFLVWGPIMIAGGYYVITGKLSIFPFLVSIPYGIGVMSILLGKHIDQIDFDSSVKQKTLPVLIGEKKSRILIALLVLLMYAFSTIIVLLTRNLLLMPVLVVFLNIPQLVKSVRGFLSKRPEYPPSGYVGWPLWYHRFALVHNRRFGWLYIFGLFLAALVSLIQGYGLV